MKTNTENKSTPEILRQKAEDLLKMNSEAKILELIEELALQNEEKDKRAAELIIANNELVLQQDNLKKIASRLPGFVYQYLLRPDGTSCFPYASEAIRELFRVSPDEVREDASKVFAISHPDDLAGVVASIRESAQNLTPWQHEYRVKFDDGTVRSLYGNAVPQKDADGSVLWHGFITDITEDNRLKERLKSSEEQRNSILNDVMDVVWSLSWPDFKVNFISKSVEQVFGRNVREFIENPSLWADTVHPDDRHISDKAFEQLIKEGSAVRECRIIKPNGSIVWISDKSKIIADHNGKPIRIDGVSRDITGRKQVEDALQKSEELYRKLLRTVPDMIIMTDIEGNITYANDKWVSFFDNAPKENIIGQNMFSFIADHDLARAVENTKLMFTGPMGIKEYQLKFGDKILIDAEINGDVIRDRENNPLAIVLVIRNISNRKKAEDALRKSEEDFKAIANYSASWEAWFNPVGKLIWMNPYSVEVSGYTPEEYMAAEDFLSMFCSPEDLAMIQEKFMEGLNGSSGTNLEARALRKDGSTIWVSISWRPIFDANGAFIGLRTSGQDITERKRLEEEKRKIDSKILTLSMAIGQSPVTTMITDIAGNIEFVNPKFTQITGYTAQEAIGQNPRILKAGDKSDEEYGKLWDTILSGQTWHGVFQNKKKNGELYWESAVISPVKDNEGVITHFLAVKEDITERLKSEAALKKAKADAEAANKSKSTFLANMSHEIRTPLNAIIGFSQLMNREKLLTESQKEHITTINRAGEHLLKLINDILELSKIEAGRVELKPENFDLHALLNDMQMMFKERAQSKKLRLMVEIPADLPQFVVADDQKLRQIFINLIGNAIKFTDKGGISVRSRIEKGNYGTSRLIVEIEDTGPGMSEDELGKLFKHFEQTSAGIKSSSGTGLGLALSRELALLMGGNITVASEEGKGSVFTVNVEIQEGKPEVGESAITKRVVSVKNPQNIYRVLVVDDKEENRQVAVSFLKLVGFQTNEAINGQEAIARFEQWNPHLILMDMRMPVMDGYEATRRIKATEMGRKTPIVAVTAGMPEDEKKETSAPDLQGYIRKPFHENELFAAIGTALGIEYIYEEETTPASLSKFQDNEEAIAGCVSKLPNTLILQMLEAVESGDFHQLVDLIKTIENDNPELASHLMSKANNYDYGYFFQALTK